MDKNEISKFLNEITLGENPLFLNPDALEKILGITYEVKKDISTIVGVKYGLIDDITKERIEDHIKKLRNSDNTNEGLKDLRLDPELKKYIIGIIRLISSYSGFNETKEYTGSDINFHDILNGRKNLRELLLLKYTKEGGKTVTGFVVEDLVILQFLEHIEFLKNKQNDNNNLKESKTDFYKAKDLLEEVEISHSEIEELTKDYNKEDKKEALLMLKESEIKLLKAQTDFNEAKKGFEDSKKELENEIDADSIKFSLSPNELDHEKIDFLGIFEGIVLGLQITFNKSKLKQKLIDLGRNGKSLEKKLLDSNNGFTLSPSQKPDVPVLIFLNTSDTLNSYKKDNYREPFWNFYINLDSKNDIPGNPISNLNYKEREIIKSMPGNFLSGLKYVKDFFENDWESNNDTVNIHGKRIILHDGFEYVINIHTNPSRLEVSVYNEKLKHGDYLYSFTFFHQYFIKEKLEKKKRDKLMRTEKNKS